MDQQARLDEIQSLRARLSELEEQGGGGDFTTWTPPAYYTTYELMAGAVLGIFGACTSLLFNVAGASLFGKHALELVRVYLTFGMGEEALSIDTGVALSAGVGLYVGTGMLLGIPIHMLMGKYFRGAPFGKRFLVVSVIGLLLWVINYYAILSWLQPLMFGGSWIVKSVPFYVAATTHLVFAWTMLIGHRWGQFVPADTKG